ncbi:hypothetical protein OB955_10790 [Halobacteria archaeon AArc-m2/3/4]|uniref:Uncharacterized protein n=1 Tax=Natronoglomus mannanivorans TaxID=2979990 RepID=A0AAP2YYU9_9EURY|nr:hypothetical protein [Halobacteria archaeon AArc-xg1-1]MCU4973229.1 hypothetical protein [Halobacteria archaeon AArc-m2/3/4]
MPEIYLLSTLLMGLLLIAVATAISRSGQRATPSGHAGSRSGFAEWSGRAGPDSGRIVTIASNPVTWTVSFILLAVALLAGAVLMIEGLPEGMGIDSSLIEMAVLGLLGALLLGFVFFGAYFSARDRVGYTAAGVAVASVAIGVLLLIAVVAALLMA